MLRKSMSHLKTYTHTPSSGEKPTSLVVLLHGLGSNGQDLIGLARYWERALPRAVFVSPDAPFPCDMSPPWMENSYQWFSLQTRDPSAMLRGAETAFPILNEYINKMRDLYELEDKNIVLGGFSQGAMMSLYTAPRRAQKIAGVIGYSGALIGGDQLSDPDKHKLPVLLVHGEADSVVPVSAYHQARDILTQKGWDVAGHTAPGLDHTIDDRGIESAAEFLIKNLS